MRTLEFWKGSNLLRLKISGVANEDNFKVLDAHTTLDGEDPAIGIDSYWVLQGMNWKVGDSITIVDAKTMAETTLGVTTLTEINGQATPIALYTA